MAELPPLPIDSPELADSAGFVNEKPPVSSPVGGVTSAADKAGEEVIVKTDDRGRTIDIHALRYTFGTHLSKVGVPLRTAQAAMRHSDPSLTANVYTDPKLLDVAGAVASLPDLPLAGVGGPATAVVAR